MKEEPEKDPYDVLGVPFGTSDADIAKAYRKLALKLHPDKTTHLSEQEQERIAAQFHDIQVARTFLLENPEARRKYDTSRASKMARQAADEAREQKMSEQRKRMREELQKAEAGARKKQMDKSRVDELRRQGDRMREDLKTAQENEEKELRKQAKASLEERQVKVKWSRKKIKISPSEHSLAELFGRFGQVQSVEMLGSKGNLALITFKNEESCELAVDAYASSEELRASYVGQRKDRERDRELQEDEPVKASSRTEDNDADWRIRREAEREALLRQMEAEERGEDVAATGTKRKGNPNFPPAFPDSYGDTSPFEKLLREEDKIFSSILSQEVWNELKGIYS